MKKKKAVAALCIALSGAMCVSFCACELFGSPSSVTGDSPYEVATELGYDGSAADWLAAQNGSSTEARRLYEEAKADGYEGTFVDFLKELGLTVPVDDSAAIHRSLLSVVSIQSVFQKRTVVGSSSAGSLGSGVIYSLDKEAGNAYIITNYHVIYAADSAGTEAIPHISDDITVYLYGGETENGALKATYLGGVMDYDLAVLQIKGTDTVSIKDSRGITHTHTNREVLAKSAARAITAGDSNAICAGERVYAIGNPEGEGISVTEGVISVESEYIEITSSDEKSTLLIPEIRTDAAVNHGNSGGGLFSADGKFIGTVNARAEESDSGDNIVLFGYAIPSNVVLSVVQNILDNKLYKGALRAWLGVSVYTADSCSAFNEETQRTFVMETIAIESVSAGSIAYGKLQAGDTFYSMKLTNALGEVAMDQTITRRPQEEAVLFNVRKGDTLEITVSRNGGTVTESFPFLTDNYFKLYN